MSSFDNLEAFKAGYQVGLAVYLSTEHWPKREMFGLSAQARKAAFSISLNIAEGSTKRGTRELRRFLDISLGSLAELEVILRMARDLGLTADEEIIDLEKMRATAGRLTWRLYQAIARRC
jgi:four helix bundle protein